MNAGSETNRKRRHVTTTTDSRWFEWGVKEANPSLNPDGRRFNLPLWDNITLKRVVEDRQKGGRGLALIISEKTVSPMTSMAGD